MIDRVHGQLLQQDPTHVVVDVGGVGLLLHISLQTYEKLGPGREVTLHTHLHVREDILALYGFAERAEREAFRILIGISGVGPRVAQAILSSVSVGTLRDAVAAGDWKRLTAAPGVGRKLAERMTVELRGKFGEPPEEDQAPSGAEGYAGAAGVVHEAAQALMALGHNPAQAEKLAVKAAKQLGTEGSVQDVIKVALKP